MVATSFVIARRRLPYEWWYAVHLLAYAGIALAWFHEIPTGNELVLDHVAADWWRALYVATLAILVGFRVVAPLLHAFRHRLRVAEVVEEGPESSRSASWVGLDRLAPQPGQFFLWRFLDRAAAGAAHPFSLSAAPDGRSLRITVKASVTTPRGSPTSPGHARRRRGPVRHLHRGGAPRARRFC